MYMDEESIEDKVYQIKINSMKKKNYKLLLNVFKQNTYFLQWKR